MPRLLLAQLWLSSLLLVGCKAGVGEPCTTSEDCEAPFGCFDQKCAAAPSATAAAGDPTSVALAQLRPEDPAEAVDALLRLDELARAQPDGSRAALLARITGPLAEIASRKPLDPKRQAAVLQLLAESGRPEADPALVAALQRHRVDDEQPGPVDLVMAKVVSAAADRGLEDARAPLFKLFTALRASSRKGEAGGLAKAVGRAVERLAAPTWRDEAIRLLEPPIDPNGRIGPLRDAVFTQRTAARILGSLAAPEAVEPLFRVVLDPHKRDVASAAVAALGAIGEPAREAARSLLAEGSTPLHRHAEDSFRLAREHDLPDVVDQTASDDRVTMAAVVLAHGGQAADEARVLEAMKSVGSIGRGRIAAALPFLPPSDATVKAFKDTLAESPLDLPIDDAHRGVAALIRVAPGLHRPEIVPWLADWAIELTGTDTALAPFREAALDAVLLAMSTDQTPAVQALADLITKEKWQARLSLARQLSDTCKHGSACWLDRIGRAEGELAPFEREKAAVMAATFAKTDDERAALRKVADGLPDGPARERLSVGSRGAH
ncbi:MAG: HEAT repeat domain-containing protein [Polyangiaceae bacterium]